MTLQNNEVKIVRTYLSLKPKSGAIWPVLFCQAIFFGLTLLSWESDSRWPPLLTASKKNVFIDHEYWRLFTTLGVHADMQHFSGNFLFFVPFAWSIYGHFGAMAFPGLTFLAGAFVNAVVLWTYPADQGLIGASGMVYFMVAFWLVLYVAIERSQTVWQRTARCTVLVLAELAPQVFDPQVSYLSHIVGFLLGIVFGVLYFYFYKNKFRRAEIIQVEPQDEDPSNLFQ